MVLNEMILLGCGHLRIVFAVEERPRRRNLESEGELASTARVDRVIDRRTTDLEVQRQVMTCTILDQQIGPVFHHVHLVTQLAVEREIVIRPAQTFTVSD